MKVLLGPSCYYAMQGRLRCLANREARGLAAQQWITVLFDSKVSALSGFISRAERVGVEKADVSESRKKAKPVCTTHFLIDRSLESIYTVTTGK